ncbi:MAG: carbohydrate kinase [Candidatus Limnocylindrales bacterium]
MFQPDPPKPLITCMGEILVDFLPVDEGGQTVGFRMHPGGSLLNVAVAVTRLGGRSALVTKTGTDFFGRYLRAYAQGEGIDTRWLSETAAPSTLGFVTLTGGEPHFTFYGDGAADTRLTRDDLSDELIAETAILHVGSISLLRGSTPATVIAACERMRGRALLSLDPNLRPSLVLDEPAYRATLATLVGLVDVVKVSAADLAWLAPGRDVTDAAVELLDQGPALVAVTLGESGVLAVRRTADGVATMRVPGFRVSVADTVGAGDSVDGGLLTKLAERGVTSRSALTRLGQDELAEILRFAVAVAALNCSRPGADPPRRADVDTYLAGPVEAAR